MTAIAPALPSGGLPVPAQFPSPSNFEAYARMANAMPMLEEKREEALVQAWREHQDADAARELVLSHLRLVVRVVRDHRGYGLPEGDLAQEGTVGLMRAVHRFDPRVGVRLAAYAVRWIEAEVREFIFKNFRMVRLGASSAMKKLFFGYRKTLAALREMGDERGPEVSSQDMAKAMGVTVEQAEVARAFFTGRDLGWEAPSQDAEEGAGPSDGLMLQALPLEHETPATLVEGDSTRQAIVRSVQAALSDLSERDQAIVRARRLTTPAVGLAELGAQWGISAERVRQIEQRAVKLLETSLHAAGAPALLDE